ncbi:MAG: hypothetical protein CO093_05100 [Alphaproteobacteria bacterium CG_4_9_14_3_um_filter_47_13]|nr:MAG: hypothetical protein CO093_05100 [Alphaproteobacteria bacterium CG_4_9_14_3_um_filter_47_13]
MNDLLPIEQNQRTEIPEKFRDPQTGALRTDALLQSYLELERRMSSMPRPPASVDEYQVDTSHGLFAADQDVNQKLFDNGFTLEQVQAVYDLAAEKFVPMILGFAQEFKADREVERLVAAFGGEEKWQEVSRQLLAYGKKNLPPEVLASLSNSFEGVMALHRMMKGQEPGISVKPELSGAEISEGDLGEMMRDPRYYRDRDPSFVAKVTQGFQRMYGEK